MRCGAAEPVAHRDVSRVTASPTVAKNFLTAHAQNEAEFVIVGVASFTRDAIWNGEEQQFSGPMPQHSNPRVKENFDRAN